MNAGNKIILTAADRALFDFDAERNVEPWRTVAQRIAAKHGHGEFDSIVDEISHALEDAMDIGRARAALEEARS